MIIQWNKNNVNIIPVIGPGNVAVGKITLLPGMNDVDDQQWAQARVNCKDDLDRGVIKEIAAEVSTSTREVEDPKTKEKKRVPSTEIKAKSFKDLSIIEATKIVKDTYNLKTLKGWEKNESRDSVRAEIKNQIDDVEKYGEDRKKKLKRESDKKDK